MSISRFVIFMETGAWLVARTGPGERRCATLPVPDDAPADETATAAAEALHKLGHRGEDVLLAPPAASCLSAAVPLDRLPRRRHREALLYRLEEKLPLDAEDLTADFYVPPGKEEPAASATGVCIETARLRPILDALHRQRIHVRHVSPAAWLAYEELRGSAEEEPDALILTAGGWADLLTRPAEGGPIGWSLLPDDSEPLARRLRLAALHAGRPLRVLEAGLDRAASGRLADLPELASLTRADQTPAEAAARFADRVLRGARRPPMDLRRGPLRAADTARRLRAPAMAGALALLLLLSALIGVSLWRAQNYHRIAARHEHQQRQLFRRLLPEQQVPLNVEARLASERRRLAGLSGHTNRPPSRPSALARLYGILAHLPDDLRFRVLELRIEPQRLRLDGQARTHADAETIANTLRQAGPSRIVPPRTQRLRDRGVGFVLNGDFASPPAPASRGEAGP